MQLARSVPLHHACLGPTDTTPAKDEQADVTSPASTTLLADKRLKRRIKVDSV